MWLNIINILPLYGTSRNFKFALLFNSEPTTERIKDLKKEMNDCKDISKEEPFGPSETFNGFKYNESVTLMIDYIFVSKNNKLKVEKYAILCDSKDLKYPSDHFPVYVKLNYN